MTENQKALFQFAAEVQPRAHAPYSGAQLGAAVLMSDGRIFAGCNVENASYGGTVCAERIAIFKSVTEGSTKEILEIMVVVDGQEPWPPCGFCRQVISEFATPATLVHTYNLQGQGKTFKFSDLLPEAFTAGHLKDL